MVRSKKLASKELCNIYASIDKSVVIQDSRIFNETPLNSKKCTENLINIFFLLYTGTQLNTQEAISLFFTLTKSFQSKHLYLKRLVYVLIKHLAKVSNDTIIATSSLTQEFNSKNEPWYKAAALKALLSVVHPSMIQSVERVVKQSILEKEPCVSSAAIVSAYFLFDDAKEAIRRWTNEIQSQITSDCLTQYHALGLLYLLKQNDRVSLLKLLTEMIRGSTLAPSYLLVLRYLAILTQEGGYSIQKELSQIDFAQFLRYKGKLEMVSFEAAKLILPLADGGFVGEDCVTAAIQSMNGFLASTKALHRFCALKILNSYAAKYAVCVGKYCNGEIENLVTDANRSIATYAIAALLKTGNEASIDFLIKQIESLFNEISDEFKIVVVEAIDSLCKKFPAKQSSMLEFLTTILRQEGGYEFKSIAVKCITAIFHSNASLQETILCSLAEYIEDCEHVSITVTVLHLLGDQIQRMTVPSKFIRIIYNRILLETPPVRIAALSALFRIAMSLAEYADDVRSLLTQSFDDPDDEVRETALLYSGLLDDADLGFLRVLVAANSDKTLPLSALEQSLTEFAAAPISTAFPIDADALAWVSKSEEISAINASLGDAGLDVHSPEAESLQEASIEAAEDAIFTVKEVSALGSRLARSQRPLWLTERETEFVVCCFKHVFSNAIVFEFAVRNTLENVALLDVSIELHSLDAEFDERLSPLFVTKIDVLLPGEQKSVFAGFSFDEAFDACGASFGSLLVFFTKEFDEVQTVDVRDFTDTCRDEYQVEDVDISIGDFCCALPLTEPFARAWENASMNVAEHNETIALGNIATLQSAVASVAAMLGHFAVDHTERVPERDAKFHRLHVSLHSAFDANAAALLDVAFYAGDGNAAASSGVFAEVAVKGTDLAFVNRIADCLTGRV